MAKWVFLAATGLVVVLLSLGFMLGESLHYGQYSPLDYAQANATATSASVQVNATATAMALQAAIDADTAKRLGDVRVGSQQVLYAAALAVVVFAAVCLVACFFLGVALFTSFVGEHVVRRRKDLRIQPLGRELLLLDGYIVLDTLTGASFALGSYTLPDGMRANLLARQDLVDRLAGAVERCSRRSAESPGEWLGAIAYQAGFIPAIRD